MFNSISTSLSCNFSNKVLRYNNSLQHSAAVTYSVPVLESTINGCLREQFQTPPP